MSHHVTIVRIALNDAEWDAVRVWARRRRTTTRKIVSAIAERAVRLATTSALSHDGMGGDG